jgi:hypothetical protein
MSAAQPVERPRVVTILGWAFLVVSVLLFLRSAINFLIFEVLESQAGELLSRLSAAARPFVPEWMLRHASAIWAGQAVLAALVAATAWSFLSLKPWARLCLQGLCWAGLALLSCVATLWVRVWSAHGAAFAAAPSMASRHGQILYGGLAILGAWALLLGLALYFLRSAPVRLAFEPPHIPPPDRLRA